MSDGLDLIIIDDDSSVCETISSIVNHFYKWGDVIGFVDIDEALSYCQGCDLGVGIFIIDVFLGSLSGFDFIKQIEGKFPSIYEDTIIITGNASDELVNRCISSNVNYLLEKPIMPYALQLAVRSIAMKYLTFAKRLLRDPVFAADVSKFQG
ncbi:MAG: response regulator [Deltaproteobacteria bacterium]|jgi:DNA-binding NarL/FixJ family response regulator|nr:response regulator [Deltaproteobacteria bacterium]